MEAHGFMSIPTMWKWAKNESIMGSFFALANFHFVDQIIDLYGNPEWVNGSLWKQKEHNCLSKINGSMFFGYNNGFSTYVSYSMGVPNQKEFLQFRLVHSKGMIEYRDNILYLTKGGDHMESFTMKGIEDNSILYDTNQFIQEIEKKSYSNQSFDKVAKAAKICLYAQQSSDNGNIRIDIR